MSGVQKHANQMPGCRNCGRTAQEHEKERVFPDDGPAGSWHWRYNCPDGSGTFTRS